MDLENGLEVVLVDNSRLEKLRRENDSIDTGAALILESLDTFAEEIYEKYEEELEVPYDKLFFALKQAISSACEKKSVRDAFLTGLIQENKHGVKVVKKATVVKEQPKPVVKTEKNKAAIANYARNHTIREIAEHFNFESRNSAKNYLEYHRIKFVHSETTGRPKLILDNDRVAELAKEATIPVMASLLGCSVSFLKAYMKREGIVHIPQKKKKIIRTI